MSILHLPDRTTTSDENYRRQISADASRILVEATATVESFSIELTVGANWSERYGKTNAMVAIGDDGIALAAGASIVVEVAEEIGVPFNMYGLVIPTGSLFLDQGIIIAAAKIEPAFRGRLKLRLVNISGERRTIDRKLKVASAIFFATDHTKFHSDVTKRPVTVVQPLPVPRRLMRWISANRIVVIGWIVTILGSSVAALLINYLLLGARPAAAPLPPPPSSAVVDQPPHSTALPNNTAIASGKAR